MRYIKSFANDSAIQEAVDNKTLGKPYVALNESAGTIDWNSYPPDYSKMYLTIEALEDGLYSFRCWEREKIYSYSINEGEWIEASWVVNFTASAGDTIRLKSTDSPYTLFDNTNRQFNAYGNVLSMVYGDNFIGKNDSYCIKFNSTKIVDASNLILPATALTDGCYKIMFMNCKSLIKAPALPATTLADYCYCNMFAGCTSLTTAPELPATTLADYCYDSMFSDCASLNYIKSECLNPTDIYINEPTINWLAGVSPTGTFIKKAGVNWPTGNSGIPSGWTVIEE